jgi:hypothetical protein
MGSEVLLPWVYGFGSDCVGFACLQFLSSQRRRQFAKKPSSGLLEAFGSPKWPRRRTRDLQCGKWPAKGHRNETGGPRHGPPVQRRLRSQEALPKTRTVPCPKLNSRYRNAGHRSTITYRHIKCLRNHPRCACNRGRTSRYAK